MELENVFWTAKRDVNYGLHTVKIDFRFETLINNSALFYRLSLHITDDSNALYSCILNTHECLKFINNIAAFPKSLHELFKSDSSLAVIDLIQVPDDRLLISIRTTNMNNLFQQLPFFSVILNKASLAEQNQNLKCLVSQLKSDLIREQQMSMLLKTQNEHLLMRLTKSEEASTLIQQAIKILVARDPTLLNSSDPIPSETSTRNQGNLETSTGEESSRDEILLGIASYLLCAVCEKVSVPIDNSTELNRHFIEEHVNADDSKCLACPNANVLDLLSHMKMHTQRIYACEFCGRKGRKNYLKSHVRTHTGEKPFLCLQCGRKFADQSTIRRHQTTVHSVGKKKFRCGVCKREMTRKDNYRVHMKTHKINESPEKTNIDAQESQIRPDIINVE